LRHLASITRKKPAAKRSAIAAPGARAAVLSLADKRTGLERAHLGERLRKARLDGGWTLEDVSRRTGVARSTLSKIENGMMSPTFDILQKIVSGLSLDLVDLFDSRPHAPPPGRRSITRRGEGSRHPTRTYGLELLATDLIQKRFLPFKARIVARRLEDFDDWGRHDGEEFLLVLSGEVTLYTECYAPARLGPGDSAYLDSRMGHAVTSESKEDAEVLWVSSAPPPPDVRERPPEMNGSTVTHRPTR
jgi:transcriptional regulator with XRE-family HTH domain